MFPPPMDQPDLLRTFGIGPDDLAANRAGRLGAGQARRLLRTGWLDIGAALVVGVVLLAILLFVADKPLRPAQWITALVLFLVTLAVALHFWRRVHAAVTDGRVERVTGPVTVESRGNQGWFLRVAEREFRLPVRPWRLEDGAAYHVYVTPVANRIVAMERV